MVTAIPLTVMADAEVKSSSAELLTALPARVTAPRVEACTCDGKRHGLVGVGADLELRILKRSVEKLTVVELNRIGQTVQFGKDVRDLSVQRRAIAGAVGVVGRLDGKLARPLEQARDRALGPVRGLQSRHAVVRVSHRLVETAHLRASRSEIANPAASSAALLIRIPVESL
jgi:hypothetical protein